MRIIKIRPIKRDNVLTLIGENENYSRFYNALLEYDFEDLLSKNQYFTVFVRPMRI